jgi:ribosomal protein S12 methylthiotransferase
MLRSMNRHTNKEQIYELVDKIREKMPDAIIRTTVMVGYHGETTADFNELIQGLKDLKFDRLGAFKFSKEEDTVANNMPGDVLESVKQKRYNLLMGKQQEIMFKKMKNIIGQEVEVLVENISEDNKYFVCRSYMEAPDVDPRILLPLKETTTGVIIGSFITVIITGNIGYDYICKLKEE